MRQTIGFLLVLAVALALPAAAQFRGGVPASVTSFGFGGHPGFGGVPASVTSPGFGFVPSARFGFVPRPFFNGRIIIGPGGNQRVILNSPFRHRGFFGTGFGRGFGGGFFPGSIVPFFPAPVLVPYYDYSETEAEQPMVQPQPTQPVVVVVPERAPAEIAERQPAAPREAPPAAAAQPERPIPPTIIVLKNGQKLELTDYAITGDTLYDLRDGRRKKISLAEVDVPATVKLNEDRGVEFSLPTSAKAR